MKWTEMFAKCRNRIEYSRGSNPETNPGICRERLEYRNKTPSLIWSSQRITRSHESVSTVCCRRNSAIFTWTTVPVSLRERFSARVREVFGSAPAIPTGSFDPASIETALLENRTLHPAVSSVRSGTRSELCDWLLCERKDGRKMKEVICLMDTNKIF